MQVLGSNRSQLETWNWKWEIWKICLRLCAGGNETRLQKNCYFRIPSLVTVFSV